MNRAIKIILVLVSMILLCSCTALPDYVLDVSYKQEQVNISEIPNIPFSVGVGHIPVGKHEEYQAWLIVTAEGCSINGEEDVFRRDYEDFYLKDIYSYIHEITLFGLVTKLYPQYYETIEISFPQQDCSSAVSIELFSTHEMEYTGREDAATVLTFRYTVKNGILTLIEE